MVVRRRSPDALLSELPDGTGVVLQLQNRCYYPLSASGVLLWHLYDGDRAVDDDALVACLRQRYGIDDVVARRDVDAFVARLVGEKILVDTR